MIYQIPEFLKDTIFVDQNECWIYKKQSKIRPTIWADKKNQLAYRLIYKLLVGKLEDGQELHHKCKNRRCCNPEHLEVLYSSEHGKKHGRPSRLERILCQERSKGIGLQNISVI